MPVLPRIIVPILVSLLLFSCRKPVNVNWDVDLAVPMVNAELSIRNFLGDSLVESEASGLLHFVLNREVYHVKLDSLFQLPDTTITNSFTFAVFGVTLQPGQTFTQFPASELEFKIGNDAALKRFDVRKGLLTVQFSNDLTEVLDLLYVIPNATKNGQALTITESIPPGQHSLTRQYDLAGYSMDMRGLNGNKYNTISQAYTLGLNPNSNTVVVNYGKGAKVELTYSAIVPQFLEGYFGQEEVDIETDTIHFDIDKSFETQNFLLDQVSLDFYLKNEFGAEVSAQLSNIASVNSREQQTVTLQSNQLSAINLNRASRGGNQVFPSIKLLSLNNLNSNVVPFISNIPDKLSYSGKVKLNPLGNIAGYNDFAFYNTGLRVWADVDIPLRYQADYFQLRTKADFSIGNPEQLDRVNGGQLLVYTENGFPFDAKLQVYLFDEQGFLLDSLFTSANNTIPKGNTDAQNDVIAPVHSQLNIPVDREMVESIKKARSVEIRTRLIMTPNPPMIRLYDSYRFKVRIVGNFNYHVEV